MVGGSTLIIYAILENELEPYIVLLGTVAVQWKDMFVSVTFIATLIQFITTLLVYENQLLMVINMMIKNYGGSWWETSNQRIGA